MPSTAMPRLCQLPGQMATNKTVGAGDPYTVMAGLVADKGIKPSGPIVEVPGNREQRLRKI